MNIIHAAALGFIQGFTEFVPISSSGHLVLLRMVFGIDEPPMFFDVMLHVGTLLAVFSVFYRDIWNILRKPFQPLTGFLVLGTIPTVIMALVFRGTLEEAFSTGHFLGISFLLTSAFLCVSELLLRRKEKEPASTGETDWRAMTWKKSLIVGVFQALAIVPGLSRSGATITGALSCKLGRNTAARFSFLLSIPAILGALVLHLPEMLFDGNSEISVNIGAGAVIVGTLTAAVVGFFAIRFMLKIIREKSLFVFAIYTAVLGVLVLLIAVSTVGR